MTVPRFDPLRHELRLMLRARLTLAALLLLLALSSMAVWSGLQETARQRQTIDRVLALNERDVAVLAARSAPSPEGGSPAYYTFYPTWDAPSDTAFLALGLRDVAPFVMRIRALGLHAQLYDGENFNPEVALPGRFDFAFVLIYLTPLFVIALLHDLVSGERQSGRLRMLAAMPGAARMWRRRVLLRYALLLACLVLPALAGMAHAAPGWGAAGGVLAVTAAYLAFWTGIALLVGASGMRPVTHATALVGVWAVLTLVLPSLANGVLGRAIPVHQGVDLMLAQRELVHGAWDVPRAPTMARFYAGHPAWAGSAPLPPTFHWKWLFAFNALGDEGVARQASAYRAGLMARQDWTVRLGWLLPGVGAQAALHRLAATDLPAQLAYQDRTAAFHREIRQFYYGYLFRDRPFGTADFARRPVFVADVTQPPVPWQALWPTVLLAGLAMAGGMARLRARH
jgi:ABC-2 type transport system permease protein